MAGKADWLAFGLPCEGEAEFIADLVVDVPTCAPGDRLTSVRAALATSPLGTVVVVDAGGVVLGRLGVAALDAGDDTLVEELMGEGPATVRPSEEAGPLRERMRRAGVEAVIVTRSDGILVGGFAAQPPPDAPTRTDVAQQEGGSDADR